MDLKNALVNLQIQTRFSRHAAYICDEFNRQTAACSFKDITVVDTPPVLDAVQAWAEAQDFVVDNHPTDPTVLTVSLP